MPVQARDRVRPWLGSAALHLLFLALLIVAAVRWRFDSPPPPQLAIEGSVVREQDLPSSVRTEQPTREITPEPVKPTTVPEPPPPTPSVDESAQREVEQQQQQQLLEQQRRQQEEAATELKRVEAERRAEAERQAAAERKRQDEQAAETERKAAEARREQEELQARQRKQEEQRAAREAELRKALANEEQEAGEAVKRAGVTDEYRALLVQTIERNWIRPPSARPGLECTLYVTQASGGTVIDVQIGECNGDQAVRESVANAVYRSSPLPAPRDPRAFERSLVMVFKPKE
jgi:colicin import membrane protein